MDFKSLIFILACIKLLAPSRCGRRRQTATAFSFNKCIFPYLSALEHWPRLPKFGLTFILKNASIRFKNLSPNKKLGIQLWNPIHPRAEANFMSSRAPEWTPWNEHVVLCKVLELIHLSCHQIAALFPSFSFHFPLSNLALQIMSKIDDKSVSNFIDQKLLQPQETTVKMEEARSFTKEARLPLVRFTRAVGLYDG